MAGTWQKSVLVGKLIADPELIHSKSGDSYCNVTIVTERPTRGKDNSSDFHRVVIFGKTAEAVCKYGFKGGRILVEGTVQNNNYEKNGVRHYGYNIVANSVMIVDFPNNNGPQQQTRRGDDSHPPMDASGAPMMNDDGDVPF